MMNPNSCTACNFTNELTLKCRNALPLILPNFFIVLDIKMTFYEIPETLVAPSPMYPKLRLYD